MITDAISWWAPFEALEAGQQFTTRRPVCRVRVEVLWRRGAEQAAIAMPDADRSVPVPL